MCATWWVECGGVSPSLPSRLLPHGAARAARVAAADNVRRIMLATSKAGSGRCGLGIGVQSLGRRKSLNLFNVVCGPHSPPLGGGPLQGRESPIDLSSPYAPHRLHHTTFPVR